MRLVEILESRKQAMRVSEVATLFAVTSQHIYKMTAKGMIPSLRIAGAIPQLKCRKPLKALNRQCLCWFSASC
jgi:excisionase family DNA binding protein